MADRGAHLLLPLETPAVIQTDSTFVTFNPLAPVDYGAHVELEMGGGTAPAPVTVGQLWPRGNS